MHRRYAIAAVAFLLVASICSCRPGIATAPAQPTEPVTEIAELPSPTIEPSPTNTPTPELPSTPTAVPKPLPSPTPQPLPVPKEEPSPANVNWIRTYGGSGEQVGGHVLLADDGGYFVLGTTNLEFEPEPQGDIYLLRTDSAGEVLWERIYNGDGQDEGLGVVKASEGGLVIVGFTRSSGTAGSDIRLLKVDQQGEEIWSHTYRGPHDELAGTVLETADGGYLLVGNTIDPEDIVADPGAAGYAGAEGRSNIYLVRTDAEGVELWSHRYESDDNVMASSGLLTAGGGALVVGTVLAYPEPDDAILMLRVDAGGAELWSTIWKESRASGYQVIETLDGNYMVTGPSGPLEQFRSTADFLFLKIDQNGDEIWSTSFGDPEQIDYASVMAGTSDGGIVAAGEQVRDFYAGDSDILLVKLDATGQLLSEQVIDTNAHSMLVTILEHPDGGYVIGGAMVGPQGFDIILIRIDGSQQATAAPSGSEALAKLITQMDHLASPHEEASGVVLIARDGGPVFTEAYGLADRSTETPNRVDTNFNLASMGKMFTGVAIMQLVEQGLLSVEDRIIDHLPDYPNQYVAKHVTIHQLLTHTSGMGNVFTDEYDAMPKNQLTTVGAWLPLFVDTPLAFAPGTEFSYSNAGYVVLGLIIEAVTGETYYDYVRDHIFLPSGMENTDAYDLNSVLGKAVEAPNLAIGYTLEGAAGAELAPNTDLLPARGFPAGGSYSTLEDLLRFGNALLNNRLLSPESTEILLEGKVDMRPGVRYAYGFFDELRGDQRAIGHTGGFPGICDFFYLYPDLGYTVIVLSNLDGGCVPALQYVREQPLD